MTRKSGLPTIIPAVDPDARRESIRRHIRNAIAKVREMIKSDAERYRPIEEGLREAEEYLDVNEQGLAWDAVQDTVLNSGGEHHEIWPDGRFWSQMTFACRMMANFYED